MNDPFPFAPTILPVTNKGIKDNMSTRTLRWWFAKLLEKLAKQGIEQGCINEAFSSSIQTRTFHSIRHTSLTHMVKVFDLEAVRLLAGHEDINTTKSYISTEHASLREAVKELRMPC